MMAEGLNDLQNAHLGIDDDTILGDKRQLEADFWALIPCGNIDYGESSSGTMEEGYVDVGEP